MAKQNDQTKAGAAAQNQPTGEQDKDTLLIWDKEQQLLSALAHVEKNGKLRLVPTDKNNEFLRINPSDNWFESFVHNFYSQLEDPTRFTLLRIKQYEYDDPLTQAAMKDLRKGEITPVVEEFMKKYGVTPDDIHNINQQKTEKMAKQANNQNTGVVEDQQPPRYRFNENMIDWDTLKERGLSREYLEQKGLLEGMMKGYKTNQLVPVSMNMEGATFRGDARLSFRQEDSGRTVLNVHMLRKQPELDRPFMGHIFSEQDKRNLLNLDPEKDTGQNMGRVVPLKSRNGDMVDSFISIDKMTNEIIALPVERAIIRDEISGVKLSDHEKNELREGRAVYIEGMTSKKGTEFNASIQINADRRGIEYIFPKQLKFEYGQEIGKVKLTNNEVDTLNSGRAILVEDMVSKNGNQFSSYIKRDEVSGRLSYTNYNPDVPGEIYVPKEINGVKVTPEERQQLREGKPIYLQDMTSFRGEDFSSYVRLDLQTGRPEYSHTLEGFDEKRRFEIPREVFGVTLSARQRADLQDNKAVLIEGMKGYGGKEFSQYAKLNQAGNKINYFDYNPDVKRDNSQKASQAPAVKQAEETKQSKRKGKGQSM